MASEQLYKEGLDDGAKLPLMISVTAPSTLPAGYTFEAFVNDDKQRPFTCEVVRRFVLETLANLNDDRLRSIPPFESVYSAH